MTPTQHHALATAKPIAPIPCPLCGARESGLGTTHFVPYHRTWSCGFHLGTCPYKPPYVSPLMKLLGEET